MTKNSSLFRSKISGTGSYLPERVLTNADLEKMVDTNNEWIIERTGIRHRHLASADQTTSDLALIASQRALEAAGLSPKDLDMIIFSTSTPDYLVPSAACYLQAKLGAPNAMSFDLAAACSGFVYSLTVADQFIRTGMYKNILIVGAEVLHRWVNYKDRETCILFGDGAGAAVVSRAEEGSTAEILTSHMHADGTLADLFIVPAGGASVPVSSATVEQDLHYIRMKGREIFKNAVRTLTQCCQEALETTGFDVNKIDWLVPHQANLRILDSVAHYFGIPSEKVIVNLPETGNTSAATIPIALDEAIRDGRIQRGQHILLAAFGAGLTSGSVLMRY